MATFNEQQITDLADALGIDTDFLTNHLNFYAPQISESAKTKVLARLANLVLTESNHSSFTPTESNQGFNLNADSEKTELKRKICTLLFLTDFARSIGIGRLRRT